MIIIPARLHSTRLPNKLILPIDGIPIIIRTANIAKALDSCVVACDDEVIMDICKKYKIDSILTSKNHQSGTDRCAEVATKMNLDDSEVVINLQGDEPFIESNIIEKLKNAMQDSIKSANPAFMGSCCKDISQIDADDPNLVKVVVNDENFAMYFSRSKIPHNRDNLKIQYLGHIGIYAFSSSTLKEFCKLSKSPLENIEKLEQLRALWHNKKILMVKVKSESIGIDTMQDYNNALNLIKGQSK